MEVLAPHSSIICLSTCQKTIEELFVFCGILHLSDMVHTPNQSRAVKFLSCKCLYCFLEIHVSLNKSPKKKTNCAEKRICFLLIVDNFIFLSLKTLMLPCFNKHTQQVLHSFKKRTSLCFGMCCKVTS